MLLGELLVNGVDMAEVPQNVVSVFSLACIAS